MEKLIEGRAPVAETERELSSGKRLKVSIYELPEQRFPLLRRERILRPDGGEAERWMVANHLTIMLQEGAGESRLAEILRANGLPATKAGPIRGSYLVEFDGKNPDTLPRVEALLRQSGVVEGVDRDFYSAPN